MQKTQEILIQWCVHALEKQMGAGEQQWWFGASQLQDLRMSHVASALPEQIDELV